MSSEWYKSKNYVHFDYPLSRLNAEKLVKCETSVTQHSFFPFISYNKISKRYRKVRKTICKQNQIRKVKERPIKVAAHSDSHIYSYYSHLLSQNYEKYLSTKEFGKSILAYRKGIGSNINFAKDAMVEIKQRVDCVAIAIDLKSFFDNIDHAVLKKNWKKILFCNELPKDHYAVYKAITKYSYIDREKCAKLLGIDLVGKGRNFPNSLGRICSIQEFREKIRGNKNHTNLMETKSKSYGIPQGSPISATLSNLYMIEFDETMFSEMNKIKGSYRRYCDDILIIIPNSERNNIQIWIKKVQNILLCLGDNVNISHEKTVVSIFENSICIINNETTEFQYLGFTYNGYKSFLRNGSLSRNYSRIIGGIKRSVNKAKKSPSLLNSHKFYLRAIYRRHSHVGKSRNFYNYARRSHKLFSSDLVSGIKSQLRNNVKIIKNAIKNQLDSS